MYGTETGVGASALAATGAGLSTGSMLLAGVGLVLAGIAVFLLFRKEGKNRP
jgi:hypothetical protein